jgi:hypothetical protein
VLLELGEFGKVIRNIWKIVGGGVEEGCRG